MFHDNCVYILYHGYDVKILLPTNAFLSNIQGDSGEICNTLGNDSMCNSKHKSSYEHGSDFGRLRSYDRLKLRRESNDY